MRTTRSVYSTTARARCAAFFLKAVVTIFVVAVCAAGLRAQTGETADVYLNSAVGRLRNGELERALGDLNKAIELNPRSAVAFLLRGNLRERSKDAAGALSDYDRAIELAPDAPGMEAGYNNRSVMRVAAGDIAGALDDINKAIKLNPQVAAFFNHRAVVKIQKGDEESAAADYEKALRLDPRLPSAYYGRGGYFLRRGALEEAAANYDKAIELMPDYSDAYVCRGIVRGLKRDMDGAINDIRRGAALDANAVAERGGSKFTSPFKDLSRLIASDPSNARAYELRGVLLLLQGKAKESDRDFRKSVELDPGLKAEVGRVVQEIGRPR